MSHAPVPHSNRLTIIRCLQHAVAGKRRRLAERCVVGVVIHHVRTIAIFGREGTVRHKMAVILVIQNGAQLVLNVAHPFSVAFLQHEARGKLGRLKFASSCAHLRGQKVRQTRDSELGRKATLTPSNTARAERKG